MHSGVLALLLVICNSSLQAQNTEGLNARLEKSQLLSKADTQLSQKPTFVESKKKIKTKDKDKAKLKIKKKKKNYGFSGKFIAKTALGSDEESLEASVTWKPDPKDYYYIKVAGKEGMTAENDGFSYSWGIGYDDWHEGTWTVQVNHWGGIRPGEGFDSYNSIASLGYKLDSTFLKEHKLKSTLTVAKKLGGDDDFKVSGSLQWAPKKYWFIKVILVKPVNGEEPTWNYLLGYDDWHPGTFGIEYSNYNANSLYETNFMESGKIAINYKWKF